MLEIHDEINNAIFVGNLHSSVSEEILYELFLQAGPVEEVIIPKDSTGHQRPYGFVYYKHTEAVPYAIELLNGIWLYGQPITLNYTFGHPELACDIASPHQQNCPEGDRPLTEDEYFWSDTMVGLPFNDFSPATPPVQGDFCTPVPMPSSVSALWPWLDYGYASWIPSPDEQTHSLGCTKSAESVAEQSTENGKDHKHRRDHEKKQKRKKRQVKHVQTSCS